MVIKTILSVSRKYAHFIFFIIVSVIIGLTRIYNFLIFHSLVEFFSIVIAISMFFIFWNTKKIIDNNFFVFIGTSFFFVGVIDLLHTLAYSGMGVFDEFTADLATQLWISARFFQAITLLVGLFFTKRKIRAFATFAILTAFSLASLTLIFTGTTVPLLTEQGLTTTKIVIEYIISVIFLTSLIFLFIKRDHFDRTIYLLLSFAIGFTIGSELAFTQYSDVYGIMNMVGHFLKLTAFYLFYRALVVKGLKEPINLFFKGLQDLQFQRMKALIENLPEGVVLLDENNQIIIQNIAADQFLEEILKLGKKKKINTIDGYSIEHYLEQSGTGMPFHEVNISKPSEKTFEIQATSIEEDSGTVFSLLVIRDVTVEKEITARAQSQQRMASLGKMAGGISHDLKNIINTILGATELAEAISENEEASNLHNIISKQSIKGSDLISQILDFSKEGEINPERVNLKPLIEEVVSLSKTGLPPDVKIETTLEDLSINVTKIQFEQILVNLIMNSKDALIKGGTIKLSLDEVNSDQVEDFEFVEVKDGKYVKLTVEDNGEGIDSQSLLRIFEPFFTTKPVGKGTGLGLSQVYGITRQHNGYINVKSKLEDGTIFEIYFPT